MKPRVRYVDVSQEGARLIRAAVLILDLAAYMKGLRGVGSFGLNRAEREGCKGE